MNTRHRLSLLPPRRPTLAAAAALALPLLASAQELGRVISSTPVIQQVAVPREVCTQQPVAAPRETSGAGAALGAVAGGALGSQIGDGSGRVAATAIGIIGGALLGDRIERGDAVASRPTTQCHTQTFYENRTVAYNVLYEYAGKQYSVQLPYDPGTHVRLQITPIGGVNPTAPVQPVPQPTAPPQTQAPVYIQPPVVTTGVTVLPAAVYPPVQPVVVYRPAPPVVVYPPVQPVIVHRPWQPPPSVHISVGRPPHPQHPPHWGPPHGHRPPPGWRY